MKHLAFALYLTLAAAPILRAQLVADGATNTLSNVTNTITGDVTVGTNGSFTVLVLSDNGLLTNSGLGEIGRNPSAKSNEVRLVDSTARWQMGGSLYIGNSGAFNRLAVSNGARVTSLSGVLGLSSPSASNNTMVVNGAGSVWSNVNNLIVGNFGGGNRLEVSGGGSVANNTAAVGNRSSSTGNLVLVTGANSVWSNPDDLTVGVAGGGNQLVVSNGGLVLNNYGYLGGDVGSTNNLALVTGGGSMWSNQSDLYVGALDKGNQLVVSNGGTVVASNLYVGIVAISTGNRVTVDGGTLRVTNVAGTGTLDIRRGTNTLIAGLIEVDRLLVTNSQGSFFFYGGTLSSKSTIATNGVSIGIGNGAGAAKLILAGNGTHMFTGLFVDNLGTLTGNGNVSLPVPNIVLVQAGGTVSPGVSIGRIAFNNQLLVFGTTLMEISRNGAVVTNDQIQIPGGLSHSGHLTVTNIGPTPLAAGDRFPLFSAPLATNSLLSLTLPPLDAPLYWTNKLPVDGSIEVESLAPFVTTLPATGVTQTDATLNGMANPKGAAATAWFEYGFTTNYGNVTPPQAMGSSNGSANFSQALTGLIPGVAYHFRAVASNSFGVAFGADHSFPSLTSRDYIKASNAEQSDYFGRAVAMDGDTLVIGAPFEGSNATGVNGNQTNNGASYSGAAYVFVRSGESWVQQAYLKPGNTGADDNFGQSVAVSGGTIVVGAPFEDSSAIGDNGDGSNDTVTNSGAAYVFVRDGTNWTQQAYFKASNRETGDAFGATVAMSGNTILVGASGEDSNATGVNGNQSDNSVFDSGAAYVFVRSGTNWSQQAYLKSAFPDGYGAVNDVALAVSGDTAVLGFSGEVGGGAAYVFVRVGANWTQQANLAGNNTGSIDIFGVSVAVDGDTAIVGAAFEDSNATGVNGDESNNSAQNAGAAYVFVRNGTNWFQQAYLKASNTGLDDWFGTSVAVAGDLAVVGAPLEDSNATGVNGNGSNNFAAEAGAAYLFVRSGTSWAQQAYLKASNTGLDDWFGRSVAMSGEFVVIGAFQEDSNATGVNGNQNNNGAGSSGAAYGFGPPPPPVPEITVSHFGTNVLNGVSIPQIISAVSNSTTRNFSIQNTGSDFLTGLAITFDGPDASAFSLIFSPAAPLMPTSITPFIVRFSPTHTGTNTATLHIASNDEDENPFNIVLTGLSLSFAEDRDGDGLNDASELLMASFGFDFEVSQTNLVNTLFGNLNGAVSNLNEIGFFTPSQLRALSLNSPLLAKDPFTGFFTLTIGVEKATELTNFFPFPMTAPQTIINAEGKLEFQFNSPDGAAFFRLEAR